MKVVVVIPAYNEEENIEKVIKRIPRKVCGDNKVEVLVIDDGSTDKTADLAFNAGATIISHKKNLGVGAAFMTGIRNAISMNADVVVTIDADSQFDGNQIHEITIPILNHQSDVVIGSRFLTNIPKNIPKVKLLGNKIFTKLISGVLKQKFTDTQSGFRAYSKEAIQNISIINDFTYTQEVLIDLKFKGLRVSEIPVAVVYDEKRRSRVVKNVFDYSFHVLSIIIRTLIYYRPIFVFGLCGIILLAGGILAKILTILNIFQVSVGLTDGLIILGPVSFMLAIFASVVFKRQLFAEMEMRYYFKNSDSIFKDEKFRGIP